MKTDEEIRLEGMDVQNIEKTFIWQNLSKDLMIELIETDPLIKTKIDHHIIAALQGFASYPSTFYQNACYYIQNKLTEQKDLINYVNQLYMLYREQSEREYNSRTVYSLVDGSGRVLDSIIYGG